MSCRLEYRCEWCGGEFVSENNDQAVDEASRDFPTVPMSAMAIVCDDCYQRVGRGVKQLYDEDMAK